MRFIETVLIKNDLINIDLHNKRMNKTRYDFFRAKPLDLRNFIEKRKNKRVRITYDTEIRKIEYFDLTPRKFEKLKIVHADIDYAYKYENREHLNSLKQTGFDEVIIVKNSFVTDTTISNLAFFDGEKWFTPKTPLLKGTKRQELLNKNFLIEKEINFNEIKNYKKFAMINAILGFYKLDIKSIFF